MNKQPQTIAHPFATQLTHDVFEAAAGIPIHESLDAAIDRLEAVVGGIRELMNDSSESRQAALVYFAAESALALVIAAHAGITPAPGGAAC